jgi:hypothetical protein
VTAARRLRPRRAPQVGDTVRIDGGPWAGVSRARLGRVVDVLGRGWVRVSIAWGRDRREVMCRAREVFAFAPSGGGR